MVHISRTTHERKAIGTIIDNNVMLWLNEKHIEKGLDQKKRARNYNKISFQS